MTTAKSRNQKIIYYAVFCLGVPALAFVMLNLTFVVYALSQRLIDIFLTFILRFDLPINMAWLFVAKHLFSAALICWLCWLIFKSKAGIFVKAILVPVPVAVILASIGMFLSHFIFLACTLGTIFILGIINYLYRHKLSWVYYYMVILTGLLMLLMFVLGIDI